MSAYKKGKISKDYSLLVSKSVKSLISVNMNPKDWGIDKIADELWLAQLKIIQKQMISSLEKYATGTKANTSIIALYFIELAKILKKQKMTWHENRKLVKKNKNCDEIKIKNKLRHSPKKIFHNK